MFLLLLFPSILAVEFTQALKKREIVCYGDDVTEGQVIKGSIAGDFSEFSVKIQNPIRFKREGYLHQSQNQALQEFELISKHNHKIQICIQNLHTKDLNFKLSYTAEMLPTQDSKGSESAQLKGVELLVGKMKALIASLRNQNDQLQFVREASGEGFRQLGSKLLYATCTFLLLGVGTTLFFVQKFRLLAKRKKRI